MTRPGFEPATCQSWGGRSNHQAITPVHIFGQWWPVFKYKIFFILKQGTFQPKFRFWYGKFPLFIIIYDFPLLSIILLLPKAHAIRFWCIEVHNAVIKWHILSMHFFDTMRSLIMTAEATLLCAGSLSDFAYRSRRGEGGTRPARIALVLLAHQMRFNNNGLGIGGKVCHHWVTTRVGPNCSLIVIAFQSAPGSNLMFINMMIKIK